MLKDHAYAEPAGVARAADANIRPLPHDLAGARREHAEQHLHQRRLSRAVLAEQRVDFSGFYLQIDCIAGRERAEQFRKVANGQQRAARGLSLFRHAALFPSSIPARFTARSFDRTRSIDKNLQPREDYGDLRVR